MGINKTLIMDPGDESKDPSSATDNEFKPLHIPPKAPDKRFHTIIKDTTVVSDDKLKFDEEEIKRLTDVQKNYEIQEQFAEGGQGTISTGKDKILKRYVAIKSLKSNFFDNKQVIANFITEAKITAQLDHPSIIPLYTINSSEVDAGLHISMKLIHGQTLKELIDDTALLCIQYRRTKIKEIAQGVLKERLEDFVKVCDAISFAHNKNVIHKDLKPDNIMVGEFHEVYVMDWGIAALFDEGDKEDSKDQVGKIAGTPGYIAPEVVTGGQAGPASDQYALGMILFELISLKPGMTGTSINEVFEKTRDGKLESLTHRFPGCKIPNDLIAVVKKTTSIKPEDRYSSVAAMAEDVRHFLKNEELVARPDNFPRKIFRLIGKHKNLAASIVLLVLLFFAGMAIFSLIKQNRAERESKRRAVKMVNLHSSIEENAHFIDRHLFHIAHILSRFSDLTLAALKENNLSTEKIYFETSIFKNDKDLPPGTKFSPAYKRNISLDVLNYTLAPGLKLEEAETQLRKISTMRDDMLKFVMNSDSDDMILENIAKGRTRAIDEGFPICWIYVALDNGLMVNYPGASGLPEGYDPRTRKWYIDAKKSPRQKWSKPYFDISGLGVIISASKSMYDHRGTFYGTASVDMTFDYITRTLMKGKSTNPSVLARYLIDSQGNVILSSHLASQQIEEAEKNASQIKFKPFPFPEIKSHIKNNKSGQFEVNAKGRKLLIGYAPVQTLGWYYVEEVNLEQYLDY